MFEHLQTRTEPGHRDLADRFGDPLVQKAARQAASDFEGVLRKVPGGSGLTPAPYFSHLHRVATLLAEARYPPKVVAAGYLHDHLEDLPREWTMARMRLEFGDEVAELVNWVTYQERNTCWEERTADYARRLLEAPTDAVAISAADKLANIEDSLSSLRLGYPVSSFLKKGWQENSEKFHRLLAIFRGRVAPELVTKLENALAEFDRLGSPMENRENPASAVNRGSKPQYIHIPKALRLELPEIRRNIAGFFENLEAAATQHGLRAALMSTGAWADWITPLQGSVRGRPLVFHKGLGTEADDSTARVLLTGLALTLEPGHLCPPYSIGNTVVTEVMAAADSTPLSHSQNDLPAPPHSAGFFEAVPPHTCYFSCIRPHTLGGAATTVLNLPKILEQVPQALIDEWTTKEYLLQTSARMGGQVNPFKLLQWIDGAPFLRYRKEYMVGFDEDRSLQLLEQLVTDPANHFIAPLQAGETLVHWNGAPHSRLPQVGATPQLESERRKLIRCRSVPEFGWNEKFQGREAWL
jgi:hypothetical protein